jgi:hypothetical protein
MGVSEEELAAIETSLNGYSALVDLCEESRVLLTELEALPVVDPLEVESVRETTLRLDAEIQRRKADVMQCRAVLNAVTDTE